MKAVYKLANLGSVQHGIVNATNESHGHRTSVIQARSRFERARTPVVIIKCNLKRVEEQSLLGDGS